MQERVPASGRFTNPTQVAQWFTSVGGLTRELNGHKLTLTHTIYSANLDGGSVQLIWTSAEGFEGFETDLQMARDRLRGFVDIALALLYYSDAFWPRASELVAFGQVGDFIAYVTKIMGHVPWAGSFSYQRYEGESPYAPYLFSVRGSWIPANWFNPDDNWLPESYASEGFFKSDWYRFPGEADYLPPFLTSGLAFYEATYIDSTGKEFTQRLFARSDTDAKQLVNGWASKSLAKWTSLKRISRLAISATATQGLPATPNYQQPAAPGSSVKRKGRFVYLTGTRRNDIRFEIPAVSSSIVSAGELESRVDPLTPELRAKLTTSTGIPARVLKAIRYDDKSPRR